MYVCVFPHPREQTFYLKFESSLYPSIYRTHVAIHSALMQENGFEQIVNQLGQLATKTYLTCSFWIILITSSYTVDILPGLGDHDIVHVDIQVQQQINEQCMPKRDLSLWQSRLRLHNEGIISLMNTSEFNSPDDKTVCCFTQYELHKFTRTRCDLPS